jgi:hypothetical protein
MKNNQGYTVKFRQQEFIDYLEGESLSLNAENMIIATELLTTYHKLGDIICNQITQENLLSDQSKLEQYTAENNTNELVYFAKTDKNKTEGLFQMILHILFRYSPDSPLSWSDQQKLNNPTTKKDTINKCLSKMKDGDYYKFCTITKNSEGIITGGQSMLLYKSSDNKFTFFNPDYGATFDLSQQEILTKLHGLKSHEIAIMDNKRFLSRHHSKTIDKFKKFISKKGQDLQDKMHTQRTCSTTSSHSFGI